MKLTLIFTIFITLTCGCSSLQNQALGYARDAVSRESFGSAKWHLDRAQRYGDYTPEANAEMLYLRGRIQEGEGETEKAMETYHLMIKEFPSSRHARMAEERLKQIGKQAG